MKRRQINISSKSLFITYSFFFSCILFLLINFFNQNQYIQNLLTTKKEINLLQKFNLEEDVKNVIKSYPMIYKESALNLKQRIKILNDLKKYYKKVGMEDQLNKMSLLDKQIAYLFIPIKKSRPIINRIRNSNFYKNYNTLFYKVSEIKNLKNIIIYSLNGTVIFNLKNKNLIGSKKPNYSKIKSAQIELNLNNGEKHLLKNNSTNPKSQKHNNLYFIIQFLAILGLMTLSLFGIKNIFILEDLDLQELSKNKNQLKYQESESIIHKPIINKSQQNIDFYKHRKIIKKLQSQKQNLIKQTQKNLEELDKISSLNDQTNLDIKTIEINQLLHHNQKDDLKTPQIDKNQLMIKINTLKEYMNELKLMTKNIELYNQHSRNTSLSVFHREYLKIFSNSLSLIDNIYNLFNYHERENYSVQTSQNYKDYFKTIHQNQEYIAETLDELIIELKNTLKSYSLDKLKDNEIENILKSKSLISKKDHLLKTTGTIKKSA